MFEERQRVMKTKCFGLWVFTPLGTTKRVQWCCLGIYSPSLVDHSRQLDSLNTAITATMFAEDYGAIKTTVVLRPLFN